MKRTKPEPAKPDVRGKTLLVKQSDNTEFKITLPPGSRITFGPTIPAKQKSGYMNEHGYSLRVYEGKGNDTLIAVFCDVRTFRDVTLPMAKLVVREGGNELWKSDESGYEVSKKVHQERSFVDANLLNG